MRMPLALPLLTVAVSLCLMLAGCYPVGARLIGSGNLETRDFGYSGFRAVDAGSAFQITLTQGEAYAVAVTADSNIWDRVEVRQDGDTLRLGLRQPGLFGRMTLRAQITMPTLTALSLSGASQATLKGFDTQGDIRFEASGASRADGDWRASGALRMTLSGASQANLQGAAGSLQLDASGASRAQMNDYTAGTADVSLSGASNASISVSESLDYDLSGASRLEYAGKPTIGRSQSTGASSVTQR